MRRRNHARHISGWDYYEKTDEPWASMKGGFFAPSLEAAKDYAERHFGTRNVRKAEPPQARRNPEEIPERVLQEAEFHEGATGRKASIWRITKEMQTGALKGMTLDAYTVRVAGEPSLEIGKSYGGRETGGKYKVLSVVKVRNNPRPAKRNPRRQNPRGIYHETHKGITIYRYVKPSGYGFEDYGEPATKSIVEARALVDEHLRKQAETHEASKSDAQRYWDSLTADERSAHRRDQRMWDYDSVSDFAYAMHLARKNPRTRRNADTTAHLFVTFDSLAAPLHKGHGHRIDGSKVQFWATRKEAEQAAEALGWPKKGSVTKVHTRFQAGWALVDALQGLLSRSGYSELLQQRQKSNPRTRKNGQEVAQTILKQMGGTGKLSVMIGAKDFIAYPNAAAFKFMDPGAGKPNYVKITLNARDTYDVEFGRLRGMNYKVIKSFSDVYNNSLRSLFEKTTGLYLSL